MAGAAQKRIGVDLGGTKIEGVILEDTTPESFFSNPDHDRAKAFLSQVRHGF